MLVEHVSPLPITQLGQAFSRPNDVGKQDCCKDSIEDGFGTNPRKELLYLIEESSVVTSEGYVVVAGQFDELGAGDETRDLAAVLKANVAVSSSADGERGSLNGG